MKISPSFGLYAILTDPVKGYEYMTKLFVDHRIAFIQLRMKKEPFEVIKATAEKLRAITANSSSLLIINDYPEIAAEVGADGVHIGQTDRPYGEVRTVMGPHAVIGLSTHSPQQTIAACAMRPDYIGIGPVYPTPTKEKADPVIGITGLRKMLAVATMPSVAIGGIDCSNLRDVLDAGAKNFCMVRKLMQANDPEKMLEEIAKICNEYPVQ
jgi:thiamine-phosphate pyrophosphorylase